MKKILSIFSSAVIVLLAAVSCRQVEKVIVDTSKATAPVILTSSTSGGLKATYNPAVFFINGEEVDRSLVYHFFAITKLDENEVSLIVDSKDDPASEKNGNVNSVSATAGTINTLLLEKGFGDGAEVAVTAVLRAGLSATANAGTIDSEKTLEFTVTVKAAAEEEPDYFADYDDFTEASVWSVIGSIAHTGNSWGNDEPMKTNGKGVHVCEGLTLAAGDQFKFRKDADWGVNIGAEGDTEPFVVALGVEYTGKGGGKNLAVPEDGVYDLFVYSETDVPEESTYKIIKHFDNPYKTWTASEEWSVIGSIASTGNSWGNDEPMISNGTWWVCRNLELATGDQFKFRKDHDWGTNLGATGNDEPFVVTLATPTEGAGGGKNLAVPADGKYDLLIKPADNIYEICIAGTVPVLE